MTTREIVLFVYDSLMAGEEQHERLAGARPLGKATTAPAYDLVDLGPNGALVAGGTVSVSGELYALEPATMAALDIHRGHPVLNQRTAIRLSDGREAQAYLVAHDQTAGRRRIRTGDWKTRRGASGAVGARDAGPMVRWAKRRFEPR
ncbi:gamma-glutamylcyclotransferase family protein [Polyangium aurulentum]|uniref:gamma-glutamylcyclotransferase family protein n=1 Tax=Polyangium aurulentum TaxID=2567896 RepID=UPI0010AE7F44|nr:gamma-glutamylcyclotransferase family protein [Polyangium aurulentum]UQA58801.1 gamma-glutamylcyclotransferase [Polyangium aurulentum]